MSKRSIRAFLALVLLLMAPRLAAAEALVVRAGKLVDVRAGTLLADQMVRIDQGRIVEVAPWRAQPAGVRVIDWSGRTVLPGLIDLHTHLVGSIQSSGIQDILASSAAADIGWGEKNALATLMAGFTTVRDVGAYRMLTDARLRDRINAGLIDGPRMAVAGAYVTIPGGGGEVTGKPMALLAELRGGVARTPAETARRARFLLDHGADFLKLIATGAVLTEGTEPGQVELTLAQMQAAVREARRAGSYATAHAHGAEGMKLAIRAGVRSIEHGSIADDEALALMKRHGVWLVTDIYNGDYIEVVGTRDGWPEETLRKNRETTDVQRAVFRKAVKMDVKIAYGTDSGVYPHGENARQFAYMVRYGMTPMQAIQSATIHAAAVMGWSDRVGALAPGLFADLIAVDGDPLADIRQLEHVSGVIKQGKVIKP